MTQRSRTFVLLLRGINVGGKNKIGMAKLRMHLEEEGFAHVVTHGVAGNVVLRSHLSGGALGTKVEELLQSKFKLDSDVVMVVAIERSAFEKVVKQAPKEFGADDGSYRYYVLFLKGMTSKQAMRDIEVRPDVDMAWPGPSVVYYRLPSLRSPNRSKSWLNRVIQKPVYRLITIRNWNTTTKILELLRKVDKTA